MLSHAIAFLLGAVAMFAALAFLARAMAKRRAVVDGENSTEPVKENVVAIIGRGEQRHVVTNKK